MYSNFEASTDELPPTLVTLLAGPLVRNHGDHESSGVPGGHFVENSQRYVVIVTIVQ